jgi:2-polyprenyl-3-methyl-5-hydroxy-6-metoxy-1,4-benzoquinol methylase
MDSDLTEALYNQKDGQYFSHARSDILSLIPDSASRIFEVGCGDGATLRMLQRLFKPSFVGGIDIAWQAVEALRPHANLALQGNIEYMELPDEVRDIDVILCLDVLEHLLDPWTVVKRLHERLSERGVIIACIPNIRYHRVSLPLLFHGKWELENAGILDRTHLRFFVKKTAIELMTSSGLHLHAVRPTGLGRGRKAHVLNAVTFGVFENILAYQYLVRAGKTPASL